MNINNLLRDVKKSLGIGSFIKTQYTDYDLINYIQAHTRNVFSRIYGHRITYPNIKFSVQNKYSATANTYKLPKSILDELKFEETEIVGIRDLNIAPQFTDGVVVNRNLMPPISGNNSIGGYFGGPLGGTGVDQYMGGMNNLIGLANAKANMDLWRRPIKCHFIAPNLLKFSLEGMNPECTYFELTVKAGHPKSLWTINPSIYHVFLELAKFDIMEFLWNSELKGLEGLSNGYDNISLKIDDWAQAAERRREYIERISDDILVMEGMHQY